MVYRYGIHLHVIHCNDLEDRSLILRHVTDNTLQQLWSFLLHRIRENTAM